MQKNTYEAPRQWERSGEKVVLDAVAYLDYVNVVHFIHFLRI